MTKRYINIESESCTHIENPRKALMELVPQDIIFILSYPDIQYPSYSAMSMGQFCEVAYQQGDKIIWQVFNPEALGPVDDFIAKLGDKVSLILKRGDFTFYIGSPLEDFRADKQSLIYQDKYRFKNDNHPSLGEIIRDIQKAEEQRSEMLASFEEKGWKDAARVVKKYTDPVDIDYAYDWFKTNSEATFLTAMFYY